MRSKTILLSAAIVWSTSAGAAVNYYLNIDGVSRPAAAGPIYLSVTGDLDGDGTTEAGVLRITCTAGLVRASHVLMSPRDSASGQASGKRQHGATTFVKEWGAATPQLMQMKVGYDIKEAKGARQVGDVEGWMPIELSEAGNLCPAAEAAQGGAVKTRSNIQNN